MANEISERIITMQIAAGTADVSVQVPMVDITDGFTPETALTPTDFDIVYSRVGSADVKADCVALATPAITDSHLDNGCIEVDSTNMKGVYRFDFPDAPFAYSAGIYNVLLAIHHASCRSVYIHVLLQNQLTIATSNPTTVATDINAMIVQVWRRFFKKTEIDHTNLTIKTYKDDGTTVVTTQTIAESSTVETQGAAT